MLRKDGVDRILMDDVIPFSNDPIDFKVPEIIHEEELCFALLCR